MLVVSPDGTIRSLNVSRKAHHRLVNLLRQVLAQLEVVVAPGKRSWERHQTNPVGDLRVGYQVRESRQDVLVVRRRPLRYTSLAAGAFLRSEAGADPTGGFRVVLDRAGHLKHLAGQEEVDAAGARKGMGFRQRTRVVARLLRVTRAGSKGRAAARLAGLRSTRLNEVSAPPGARKHELKRRIKGLTMAQLLHDLRLRELQRSLARGH